jgi:hypothetical protein
MLPALLIALIHPSAWNRNSAKFVCRIVNILPIGPGKSRFRVERDAYEARSKTLHA